MDVNQLKQTPPWEWPKNAGDILKRALRDRQGSASDRATAANLAGDLIVMDDEMARLLVDILGSADEPEKVRARAAISMGPVLEQTDINGFDDPYEEAPVSEPVFNQIRDTLRKVHLDEHAPKEVRRRALEGAVRSPQDWQENATRAAYSSTDKDWKLTAVFCMQYVRGFDREVLESLNSPNPDIHYEAVRAAGGIEKAWPHIAGLITSKKTPKNLLLAAIEAAPEIDPRKSIEILYELDSDDEDVQEAVEEALMMARGELGEFGEDEEDDEDFPR